MFYTGKNNYEGESVRLYRSTEEIKRDIADIRKRIDKANEMLNARNILTEMMEAMALGEPRKFLPELEQIVADANVTLGDLTQLNDSLTLLAAELRDTAWAEQL